MTRPVLLWTVGFGLSAILHAAAAAGLFWVVRPGEIPDQPTPETELQLAAYSVERTRARETDPSSDRAESGDLQAATLDRAVPAVSRAAPMAPVQPQAPALAPDRAAVPEAGLTSAQMAAVDAPAATLAPSPTRPNRADIVTPASLVAATINAPVDAKRPALPLAAPSATPEDVPATQSIEVAFAAQTALLKSGIGLALAAQPAQIGKSGQVSMAAQLAEAPPIPDETAPDIAPDSEPAAETAPTVSPAISEQPAAPTLAASQPPETRARAAVAFFGADGGPVDPVSLTAFQSFMQPGDLDGAAAELRDDLTAWLSAVPCSRVQARFDPDDAALVLTGHVPEPALRETVLAAMQDRMGADIPVRGDLLILPRPQCGALAGIARVGLPQSTDQITNPLLVGEDTHAREFRYVEGDALVLQLQGADYGAYVYVDFFDADGNVVHLRPNEYTPMQITAAQETLQIGAERQLAAGEPGLYVQIGPPYGQEIAVAFASSEPLYDGVRPLVEQADVYLEWLRGRVAAARATHPDFKGEWVYFFVSTSGE